VPALERLLLALIYPIATILVIWLGLLLTAIQVGGVDEAIHKDPVAMMRLTQSYQTRALVPTQECKATGSSGWAHGTDA